MKLVKKQKNHLIFIAILLLISGFLEGIVYFHFDELLAHPLVINRFLTIYPMYNTNGSWIHGEIGIGYISWMLVLEYIVTILIFIYIFRWMNVWNRFFQISSLWLYVLDFSFAPALYRLFTRIRGVFTLDYLYWRKAVYDFPDICIGIMMAGCLLWLVPALIKYYSFRRKKIKEMSYMKKIIWELKFSGAFLKIAFLPEDRWEAEFDLWR